MSKIHGMSQSRIYHIWENLIRRGSGKVHRKHYFDKGIHVCERWKDFLQFYQDMGEPPSSRHTIDRIDNTKGYYLDNCRWATMKEQSNNKAAAYKSTQIITIGPRSQCIRDWAIELGIEYYNIMTRIHRDNIPPKVAILLSKTILERNKSGRFGKRFCMRPRRRAGAYR